MIGYGLGILSGYAAARMIDRFNRKYDGVIFATYQGEDAYYYIEYNKHWRWLISTLDDEMGYVVHWWLCFQLTVRRD